jgi:hypothetical protein
MATKAKKKSPPSNAAAPVDQSCPAEGMEHPPHKGPNPKVKGSPAPYLMVDGPLRPPSSTSVRSAPSRLPASRPTTRAAPCTSTSTSMAAP